MEVFLEKWLFTYSKIGTRYFLMASAVFVLFYIILKNPMLNRKIQQKFPHRSDYFRDVANSMVSMGIFAAVSVTTFWILGPYIHVYTNISDHSMAYYAFTYVWMFFLHDFYFYVSHRLMHHPKVFQLVHLTHHKSNNPSPWTAYAFNPLEAVIEAGILTIFAFSIPIHRSAIFIYMLFQISYNIYGHLGFEIFPANMHKHWLGKWFNTSVAHNMHHKYSVKNYGLWTTIWDRVFGTMHPQYDAHYEKATTQQAELYADIKDAQVQ
jgi:Delta7-sterol 5-desaturase